MLRQQATAGDIVLLFGDESEALTHPYLAHAWAERGADLRVPAPGQARKRALLGVLVLDHGPIHTSKLTRAAIAERPWLTIEWLPKYAPELNDIERSWRDLKRHFPAHRTFPSVEHLEFAIKHAIIELNRERQHQMCHNQRIAA